MFVGILQMSLAIPCCNSLKEKRMALNSLKKRVRNKFNVSIAEVDFHDSWGSSMIGVSVVGNEKGFLDSVMAKVVDFVKTFDRVELEDYTTEII